MTGNKDLREKIDEAKRRRLPLPDLMTALGHGERAKKTARCPFHADEHPSFSVFQGDDGFWHCIPSLSRLSEMLLNFPHYPFRELIGRLQWPLLVEAH